MKSLSDRARWLVALHNLWWLGTALANAFLAAYLWRARPDLRTVGWFFLTIYAVTPPVAAATAWLARRAGSVTAWRTGVAASAVAFLATLLAGPEAARLAVPLGALHGIATGTYWLAFAVVSHDLTGAENRASFFGYLGAAGGVVGTVAPLAAGAAISWLGPGPGYRWTFGATVVLYAAAAALSGRLIARPPGGRFVYAEVLRHGTRSPDWARVLAAHVLVGVREGLTLFLPALLVFVATGSEAAVGRYQFAVGAAGAAAYWVLGRKLRPDLSWPWAVGAGALVAQPLLLLGGLTVPALLAFGLVGAVGGAPFYIPWGALLLNVVDQAPGGSARRAEYFAVRELYMNAGRMLPIIIVLTVPVTRTPAGLALLLLAAAAPLIPAAGLSSAASQVNRVRHEHPR